ncbi:homoprotocatechuate degradation operon regulator HpaR [Tritonibacter mobilis]|uniref:homoprotocatechuate degradation operon regulator HpaR n=1 Tax=Tritonibacter mobilis TaxID=379347 RepID=UPI001C08D9DA|nr:homoprotocatechuate degradation operon regulator HpaR [Tritonibacter mobilis]MBU3034073.1 homoprotocatechuate degradation operon regulator HpaR [Tritonibacter mobilis]WHQ84080.1 homoprotocatechuate degradation operon regulator HpaR [Tritonibacter mobilis]
MTHALPKTDRSLPIALLRARERVMGPVRQLLNGQDLTEQQWRVLRVVQESGPIDPTQIADQACLLLPSLTRILQKLQEKGLIDRARDETDRRRQVITLTESGMRVIEENIDASLALIERTREKMGTEDYEALLDLLRKLNGLDL